MKMTTSERIAAEFTELLKASKKASADVSDEVEDMIKEGIERPLTKAEARRLLQKVAAVVRESARARGDDDTAAALADATFIDDVMAARERIGGGARLNGRPLGARLRLEVRDGIKPGAVFPHPTFHGREVHVNGGFVRVSDIELWDENERLDVHVKQFEEEHGRSPSPDELLQIMLSEMPLSGLDGSDQFKIVELARSIANNGVRRPPIIDLDGTLLDGNRRVTGCHYVLRSSEFTSEQKKRAEWVYVWQLTEHATDEDRDVVVVSLNFEPDHKQDWPTYVKARRIYDEFQRLLNLEPRPPSAKRIIELKREVSQTFALGPTTSTVDRFIKMVEGADDFEEYHVNEKQRDEFEVKHAATKRFEYFDELAKGKGPGGVAHTLGRDEELKHLVFDLLLQGKFRNFAQIRDIKHVPDNPDMLEILEEARQEPDVDTAKVRIDDALDIVRSRRAEKRRLGANARIEAFVAWLEDLPISAFRDNVSRTNLEGLVRALKLARGQADDVLGEKRVREILK
jgi:hypothetical protein